MLPAHQTLTQGRPRHSSGGVRTKPGRRPRNPDTRPRETGEKAAARWRLTDLNRQRLHEREAGHQQLRQQRVRVHGHRGHGDERVRIHVGQPRVALRTHTIRRRERLQTESDETSLRCESGYASGRTDMGQRHNRSSVVIRGEAHKTKSNDRTSMRYCPEMVVSTGNHAVCSFVLFCNPREKHAALLAAATREQPHRRATTKKELTKTTSEPTVLSRGSVIFVRPALSCPTRGD